MSITCTVTVVEPLNIGEPRSSAITVNVTFGFVSKLIVVDVVISPVEGSISNNASPFGESE